VARPKAPADQQAAAYRLFRTGGSKPKQILRILELEFEKPVSLATVKNWCKSFNSLNQDPRQDKLFDWDDLGGEYIPLPPGGFLLDLLALKPIWLVATGQETPTLRDLKWCIYVGATAPDLTFLDIVFLAVEFSNLEIRGQVLGEQLGTGHLNAYLVFAPWRGDPELHSYELALNSGRAPRFPASTEIEAHLRKIVSLGNIPGFGIGVGSAIVSAAVNGWTESQPGLRPQQRMEILISRILVQQQDTKSKPKQDFVSALKDISFLGTEERTERHENDASKG